MPEGLYSIIEDIDLPEQYAIEVKPDTVTNPSRWYVQISCERKDIVTGEMGRGYGGKAYLSPHMVKSEIVAMVFGLYKAYAEHECRETFKYKKRRVYGPHIDVDYLVEAAKHIEVREQA